MPDRRAAGPIAAPRWPWLVHLLNAGLLAGLLIHAVASYGALPERLPVHFDAAGQPDRWADKSWANWLALPLVAAGLTALLYLASGLVALARRKPRWLSLPHKEKFLALPAAQQQPVWQRLRAIPRWLAVPTNGLMLYAQLSIWTTAHSGRSMVVWPLLLLVGVMGAITIGITVSLVRAVRRAVERS
jgi:uncharacterized membrane protein